MMMMIVATRQCGQVFKDILNHQWRMQDLSRGGQWPVCVEPTAGCRGRERERESEWVRGWSPSL